MRAALMRTPAVSSRLERAMEGAVLGLLLLLIAAGAPFVFRYRSSDPLVWGFSARYLLGVALPFCALAASALAASLAFERTAALARGTLGRLPRRARAAVFLAALAACLAHAFTISDEYVRVLMLIALPCALALAWAMATRRVEPLLAGATVLLCAAALFLSELPALLDSSPLVVWGDESTFATLFAHEAPFMGRGGRLRAGLDARMRSPEYPSGARLVTNREGFRNEREFPVPAPAGELRVLSLGDSFSTGFNADQEAFFGALLEEQLAGARPGRSCAVMNAEVSDPAYGLWYLQNHGMAYRPDLVVYGLSGNDMMQAEQFYGADRLFRLDAAGRLEANPRWDPVVGSAWDRHVDLVYPAAGGAPWAAPPLMAKLLGGLARFRLLRVLAGAAERAGSAAAVMPSYAEAAERRDGHKRLIDGSANLGFFYRPGAEPIERMYAAAFELLSLMDRAARAEGARFLLVIYPQRYQVHARDWEVMKRRWGLEGEDFDLTLANRRMAAWCRSRGIVCCDLLEAFREEAGRQSLFLPYGDTHPNRRGHEVAARAAARCVEAVLGPG